VGSVRFVAVSPTASPGGVDTMSGTEEEKYDGLYGRRVGERLRAIRRQKRLSLQEVESLSKQEFRASVLGAYERGERQISVPRLQRLAKFYAVPVDQLLPSDDGPGFEERDNGTAVGDRKIVLDLSKVDERQGPEFRMLKRYLSMIQVQRQDFNGRVLTIRSDDLRAIACILDTTADGAARRLDDLGLRYVRPA
jgi:transcriptional regulator with XRE-family HTH domain